MAKGALPHGEWAPQLSMMTVDIKGCLREGQLQDNERCPSMTTILHRLQVSSGDLQLRPFPRGLAVTKLNPQHSKSLLIHSTSRSIALFETHTNITNMK